MYFDLPWWKATSVFWGLTLGLIALSIAKNTSLKMYIKITLIILCCVFAYPANWNYITVLWILCFGLYRGNFKYQMIMFAIVGIFIHVIPIILRTHLPHIYQIFILMAIPLIALYKGKRGKPSKFGKWSFYTVYPIHLMLLYFLKEIIIN